MFEFLFNYSREEFARSSLFYAGSWPAWLLILLAAGGAALIVVFLLRHRRQATAWRLAAVGLLQLAMLGLAILLLRQPTLETELLKPGENSVALVADASESMVYGDGESRFQAAVAGLERVLEDSDLNIEARRYTLTGDATPVTSFDTLQPSGDTTAFARSLLEVLDDARNRSLAAIILGSDGIDTAGGISAEQLAEIASYGVPIHTLAVGRDAMPEDLEISQVLVPERALPASSIAARVSVRHDRAGAARLRVYDDDELLASTALQLRPNTTTTTSWIDLDLDNPGFHRLEFSVAGDGEGENEPEMRNNSRGALVEVADQRYRVLYFEGEPRWEYKFLRRAMDDDEGIDLASLLRVSENKFYRQGLDAAGELAGGFPSTRAELFGYQALIIGSVEAASFSSQQLQLINDFVSERGGSLLMLAGLKGLGNGGWGQSAIADALPARLPPSSVESFTRRKAPVSLTPQGADLQMLHIAAADEDNRQLWQNLPEVADYQSVGELKPAAMTLLNVTTDSGTQPLMITQPFGRGHTYILATGGTWRWQMSMPVEDQSHEIFWRQLLRALVSPTPAAVSLQASAIAGGNAVQLRAEFRDEEFRPVDGLNVTVVVSHEDGESWVEDMLPSEDEAGVFVADTVPSKSGSWYYEAIAERDGEPYETARTSLYSESGNREFFNIRRNGTLLRRLADATGGRYLEAADAASLADDLRYSSAGITEKIHRPIWNAPAFFLLLLLLKSAEWLLRRRWSSI